MTDNRTTEHVCARCGKQLNPVNWWTAGVYDRFGGEKYKLCNTCAEQVTFAMQAVADSRTTELESGTCKNVAKEWEKTNFANAGTSFCCSECGAHYVDAECYYAGLADKNEREIITNFCPNCGRKVVGE